ncbi:MAG: HK97 gp10 family phage protein [Oscillospiraceae bacterium]|jgi:hypothetical protein|nr:HK97 gp10 family phage protein [Oscillospiraceae bacterium]
MSNASVNAAAIDKYRKELRAMLGDISQIDRKVLTKSVNTGLKDVKKNTPVGKYPAGSGKVGGTLRKGWHSPPVQPAGNGVRKMLENNVYYGPYVNDGHRVVNRRGETVGYVEGQHFLERANNVVEKAMIREFDAEIKRVKAKHDG